jgi:hypothetical protein
MKKCLFAVFAVLILAIVVQAERPPGRVLESHWVEVSVSLV